MSRPVVVTVATTLPVELRPIITAVSPDVELLVDDELLPPVRWPGDHRGDPAFRRTPAQQRAFDSLLARAEILYGIPDSGFGQQDSEDSALARLVRANPGLRWVHIMWAGGGAEVRAAGLTPAELDRVMFTTSAGVHAEPLAEFSVFGVLAGLKRLPELRADQAAHRWPGGRMPLGQLAESSVLLVGLGGIGARAAELFAAFGARVLGIRRRGADGPPVPGVSEIHPVTALADLVGRVDAVVISLPGTAATGNLFDAAVFAAMRPGTTLVNVGRGTVVDEAALLAALRSGQVGTAVLDVTAREPLPPDSPLWDDPSVIISPHTAALSLLEDRRIAELFAANLTRYLAGQPMLTVVDRVEFY